MARVNPLEEMVEELGEVYVQMVFDLTEEFAPAKPWWHADLSADQQLWRWLSGPRDDIVEWIYQAGGYMGWESKEETMKNLEKLFTDNTVSVRVPPPVVIQIPPELIEMVQASGPQDAAKHIRKMEKMFEGRAQASQAFEQARAETENFPEPPEQAPPLPTELSRDSAGWPLFGNVPRDDESITPGE